MFRRLMSLAKKADTPSTEMGESVQLASLSNVITTSYWDTPHNIEYGGHSFMQLAITCELSTTCRFYKTD